MSEEERVLKRGIIKEELVELCGCWKQALVLNQLLYWTKIIRETDRNIKSQITEFKKVGFKDQANKLESLIRDGWFYKRGEDLASEIMAFKKTAVNDLVTKLEKQKFIFTRPISHTNKTKYFKVNVRHIHDQLHKLGYSLEGFTFQEEPQIQEISQTVLRSGEIREDKNVEATIKGKPYYGQAEISQTATRSPQTVLRLHTKSTYTENTFFSVVVVVQKLFFEKFGIEISFESAEQVVLQHTEHKKEIEVAIEETLEWSKLTGKKINNPVGSVIYAMKTGWDLEELRKQKEINNTKQPVLKKKKRLKKLSNLPKSMTGELQVELGQQELAATLEDIEQTLGMLRGTETKIIDKIES
ncbi:hypothetical protein [Shimazuella kribbensis]|uniref:hypothetical protein n=1 Tax=Shimazuella kribbensis TaxID=139808 RepID=UPI00041C2232|nr:hypothetical protein [Shimazuella kribbensis]